MLEGKKILITGGTGTLGQALAKNLLQKGVETIRIFSRNENKQVEMERKFSEYKDHFRFLIGDVRDLPRLTTALEDIDIVFHAAALKHVPVIEYNPFEAIKTNVLGSQNVIDACLHENVKIATCISTDKAVSPLNTYGATKLLTEKLFVAAMNYKKNKTKFLGLRYGNILGSSGSVVPRFIYQIKNKKKITITDPQMTRFSITIDEALDFILDSTSIAKGSEVFVPKLKAYSILDLKQALVELLGEADEEIITVRAGEKMHEALISPDEMRYAWKFENKYIIFNSLRTENEIKSAYPGIKKADEVKYSSDMAEKISVEELKKILSNSVLPVMEEGFGKE